MNLALKSALARKDNILLSTKSKQTLYFYDLETSGVNPRMDRVMQFAGQRVDMSLKPIGEPDNHLIILTEDTLPSPDAILVTGITPQQTRADGMTEAEFTKLFHDKIATPGTVFVGFNTVRFDDEFMRFLLWRNFYDAYEWQWKDNRGRWDLLDVVRMTRALRPVDIKWPFDAEGKPTNRLELLAAANELNHANAHDALSDVLATIDLARLLRLRQPKLFDYLLSMRDKKSVEALVTGGQPFVYTSGKYSSDFEKTTAVIPIVDHPRTGAVLVYDLREDPAAWLKLSPDELVETWKWKKDSDEPRLPVKTLRFNRCPAVAPLGVLDKGSQQRLQLDHKKIEAHRRALLADKNFAKNLLKALDILDTQQQTKLLSNIRDVDEQLYDSFVNDNDRAEMSKVRAADPNDLSTANFKLKDERLKSLLPLYKARNFPKYLTDEERADWETFRLQRIQRQFPNFSQRLQALAQSTISDQKQYLLEELQLYAESIMPAID